MSLQQNAPASSGLARIGNRLGLAFMRLLSVMPLSWVRAIGWALGVLLHVVVLRRRRIARINWALCFPNQTAGERNRAIRRHFIVFAQAWLDRGWLWEGAPEVVRRRLKLCGDLQALEGHSPTVLFAPHFVGMDAGWTALTVHLERRFCGIYAEQLNADVDRWMAQGRQRFGEPHIVARRQGLKPLIAALRSGEPLYLLPDMDHGARDSVFVPFFGVQTATLASLSRFARLSGASVVPVVSRMTPEGYEVTIHPAWKNFPTRDAEADTAVMNQQLETMIRTMPEQYYWVHKRFKTRPPGEPSPYA
ncbi:lipid A biosynthesis acyltransferase [Hydrogenophaga sp.]|uniref:LpxL/LpxP family acyltransferase n=1 Tax=Hydrogenophaga sp. TaxID=1904254 RepID=UPI00271CD1F3|nr:lipid A biosynthesis acyltransferase [Hydrogenophaga sp.]MDO8903233.1 lipid A biosynthesis acyltransferase [Hydrogenophaga sp.]